MHLSTQRCARISKTHARFRALLIVQHATSRGELAALTPACLVKLSMMSLVLCLLTMTQACLSEVTGPSETPHTSQRGQAVSMEARVSLVSGLLQGTVEMYQQSVGPEGCAALTRHMLPWLVRATLRAYKTQVRTLLLRAIHRPMMHGM